MRACPNERRYRHLWIVIALVVTACGDPVPRLQALDQDATVLAFGDSLTYGTGAPTDESYPAQLSRLIGRTVINAGVPGERSEQGADRLPSVLDQHQPQNQPRLLLLCHGGNDILQRGDLAAAATNLGRMVRAARERGIDVVLIGVPQPGLWNARAPFYREIAEDLGLPLEDDALPEILSNSDLKSDTVHPNSAGYRVLAESVALLRRAGAIE